jgi:hypothetical protein
MRSSAISAEQVQYERIFTLPEEDKSDPYLPMWLIESGITAEIEMAICNCKQCKIVISELRQQQQEREQG